MRRFRFSGCSQRSLRLVPTSCLALLVTGCADVPTSAPATVDRPYVAAPRTVSAEKKIPHPAGQPVAVAIFEFRSSVTEIQARGATDMFINALVHAGPFKVVERSQMNQGLLIEKQAGSQGLSSGNAANTKLRGAEYLFEGTISEANSSETQRTGSVAVAGMSVGGGKNKDVIAIDVRVVDAGTGDILDTVTVRKSVKSDSASVSGIGNLVSTLMAQRGVSSPYTPDVNVAQQRKESLDGTLRACIDEAVAELAARF